MRAWFEALPIRRKLVTMTAASTTVALILAGGGFLIWDVVAYRGDIERDVTAQARIIGENSAPALVFGDERAAGETLAALVLRPRVVMACLYGSGGRLFATYHRGPGSSCPAMPEEGAQVAWRDTEISLPVTDSGSTVGRLFIQRDMQDLRERLLVGVATVASLVVLCTLVALGIGGRLQRSIVDPMLRLADTARAVSEERDLERRVAPVSSDEVGVVMHAFNDMLDRIAQRTSELSRANTDLQREVEERKKIEAERTLLLARERDANRLKDEFLATLSHELRTPLNAVLGWTRVLRAETVPPQTQARALASIERNAAAQARLIEDLLEVSRIVTGKLRLHVAPTDLAATVDSAVEVILPAATAKRISVRTSMAERPALTSGDPDRLRQVIWNLLSNAVKFTPPGGEIAVTVRRDAGWVITVDDTGIGIDPAFLPHMFDLFRQADGSPSREHGGLGLGLAIVRQLVELHGGTVRARSRGPGSGASFEVRLPSELAAEAPALPAETAPAAAHQPPRPDAGLLRGVRVLVVDDEEDARELLRTTLEGYGARVSTAATAADALAALDRGVPDVLISDIGMALEDGYSLIKRVRGRTVPDGGTVPAVAVTAYASASDRLAALAAGYHAHVAKPYEPAEVARLVARLTRGVEA